MNCGKNRAQIDEDSTRNEATVHGLAVEDVEVLVWLHLGLAVGIDVVFLVNHLPELGTDLGLSVQRGALYLVTALAHLKMDDFSHDWRSGGWNSEVGWFVSCGELGCVWRKEDQCILSLEDVLLKSANVCVREGEERVLPWQRIVLKFLNAAGDNTTSVSLGVSRRHFTGSENCFQE